MFICKLNSIKDVNNRFGVDLNKTNICGYGLSEVTLPSKTFPLSLH